MAQHLNTWKVICRSQKMAILALLSWDTHLWQVGSLGQLSQHVPGTWWWCLARPPHASTRFETPHTMANNENSVQQQPGTCLARWRWDWHGFSVLKVCRHRTRSCLDVCILRCVHQNVTNLQETVPPPWWPSLVLTNCNNADKPPINSLKVQQLEASSLPTPLCCCMPNTPQDLTILTLTHTTGAQLKYWINSVNWEVGKQVLNKTGRVDDLRQKLAGHYGLDLSQLPAVPVPARPSTHDAEIQRRQWDHLRQLGEAWKEAPASGNT